MTIEINTQKLFLDVLDPAKEDGFYLLKKDSQRRATLVKIMKDDKHNICSTWQGLVHKDVPDTCISIQHLSQLMDGLKAWLPEQNGNILKSTLDDLRESLDFDSVKMCQLQGALYLFQVFMIYISMLYYWSKYYYCLTFSSKRSNSVRQTSTESESCCCNVLVSLLLYCFVYF